MPFALFPLDAGLAERIVDTLGEPRSHGPYLPALRLLAKLVELSAPYLLPRAKTNVLFLSDGRPSDRVDERELPRQIHASLERVHEAFVSTRSHLDSCVPRSRPPEPHPRPPEPISRPPEPHPRPPEPVSRPPDLWLGCRW